MIGLSPSSFEEMTYRQFQNALAGYEKRLQIEDRRSWEQSRWQVWACLVPHQGKGKKLTLTDIARFEWEQEGDKEQRTPAQMQEDLESINAFWDKVEIVKE